MQKALWLSRIIGTLLILPFFSQAQLSLITGYSASYHQLDTYESVILQRENSLQDPVRTFNTLRILNGVNIGVNYRTPVVSVEALWTERFRISREETRDPTTGDRQPATGLTERFSGPSLGLNFHLDNFLLGGTLSYNTFRQSARVGNQDRLLLTNEGVLGVQVQMGYYKKLNRTNAVSIHPYVYFPFSTVDLAPFDNYLNDNTSTDLDMDFMHFGIRLFVYNGPQRYD